MTDRLQGNSFFARSINVLLWGMFHAARITRMQWPHLRDGKQLTIPSATSEIDTPWQAALSAASRNTLGNRVLIVAELSLVQCRKYRVTQKVELLSLLGYQSTILPWTDYMSCRNALQTHGMVIFYRTPATPELKKLITEARRLGIISLFDIDDLVFDLEEYRRNSNVQKLPEQELTLLMEGARLYKDMLQLTGCAIASTSVIAAKMQPLCRDKVFILENCLDKHLLDLAAGKYPPPHREVIIGYGSGTRTHDADFMVATPALLQILDTYPAVRLAIYGFLDLPVDFARHAARIIRVPFLEPDDYYLSMARFSINLAPLEESIFNDAKSNIKFLEAALFGVPSVCSPSAAFRDVIRHGENGFLASTPEEWFACLSLLVESADLRHHIGEIAKQDVLQRYSPATIAQRQLQPIMAHALPPPQKKKLRVLMVNVLFAPMSFGGATIVAEQLAAELSVMTEVEVCVFTGCSHPDLPAYELARYEWNGIPVVAIGFPASADRSADYDNPEMAARFEEVLRAVCPDIVHFHSIQMLSAALADACRRTETPYVITLHDAWWLCERQFMVRADGNYCAQPGVDITVCTSCTPDPSFTHTRFHRLWQIMADADLLLAPSEFQRNLYIRSGIPPDHIQVNKNGILLPRQERHQKSSNHITFAFLGGRAVHKGYFQLRKVFAGITEHNYTLRLVDIESKFGTSQMPNDTWQITGKLEIVPPFEQDGIDDFFNNIDVLLFPSQWKESFGLTVREAIARNVWVIATDCGGPAEDLICGENGEVVEMGNIDAFRAAIISLLRDPARLITDRNPQLERLRYFPQQAAELADILRRVAALRAE
ncbi:glycosyltransferase [Nitrosomonas sp. Nm166]|uniref:glycosyltransferase n=1 Tax=Nitrosomonas sp. Nm166 TaxID=1881054 RepID=UPI0015A5208C|nr:glycosyltransferase [Nitrosomonas sp. Nm166]